MQWLMDNWTLLASLIAAVALAGIKVKNYLAMTAEEQEKAKKEARDRLVRAVSDWLLNAVIEAERDLGSGTGKLKIRAVYERALKVFGPELAQIITLEQLDELAQKPLEEMRKLLESNCNVSRYVHMGDWMRTGIIEA